KVEIVPAGTASVVRVLTPDVPAHRRQLEEIRDLSGYLGIVKVEAPMGRVVQRSGDRQVGAVRREVPEAGRQEVGLTGGSHLCDSRHSVGVQYVVAVEVGDPLRPGCGDPRIADRAGGPSRMR